MENNVFMDMICGVKKIFDLGIRLIGPLFICLATVLVTGIIVIYFKVLIPFHSDYTDLLGLWNLAIGLWVAPNIYFNYFMCVFTWAGSPDAATEASRLSAQQLEHLKQQTAKGHYIEGYPKYCKTCNAVKPVRVHHCHICNRCVMRMDHHCPWVGNCVGFKNHKYFVLFLFYLWFGCVYVALMGYTPFRSSLNWKMPFKAVSGRGTVMFVFVVTAAVSVAVGFMLVWNLFLLMTNQTTIEFYTNQMKISEAKARGERYYNEYDLGWAKNWEQFFGYPFKSFRWLVPSFRAPPGSGSEYPTRKPRHDHV